MTLHRDRLIVLEYEVATDILSVSWPGSRRASVAELLLSIAKLTDTLRHYDIKKLFIDASENVENVLDEEYKSMNIKFAGELIATRLHKIARAGVPDSERQKMVEDLAEEYLIKCNGQITFREFPDANAAMEWLREK